MGNYYSCEQTRKDWATYYEDTMGGMDAQIRTTREAYTLFWHKNDNVKIPSAGSSSIIVMLFLHAYQIFPSFSANSCGFSVASLILYLNDNIQYSTCHWPPLLNGHLHILTQQDTHIVHK